ncbi:MAG: VWA domain-containing protein [Acidobacteriaceae bacterium]|nr:VWA domain-containing protein [Acidobacteriaceae bacterium]
MRQVLSAVLLFSGMASVGLGQILPPGQLPPGPPPQPGQLGPAPASPPKNDTDAAPKSTDPIGTTPTGTTPFGVTTRYVLVPTTVLDPDGHGYVNGLNAKDFEVFDNNKQQTVTAEFTQLPLSVVVAVQANSEIEPVLSSLKKTGLLMQGLVTGVEGDCAILAFDHRLQVLQDFTNDPAKLDDAMQKLQAGSNSARLIDAISDADNMLKRHDPRNVRRRVIIVLSRNIDKGSEGRLEETIHRMQFDNVIVYCVDINRAYTALMKKMDYPRPADGGIPPEAQGSIVGATGPRNQTSQIQQDDYTNALNGGSPILRGIHDLFKRSPAEAFTYFTGGRVYNFATQHAMEDAISDIGADLNSQYLLSYAPNDKNEPGFHTIRVTVDRPGLKIRTRPGYWWGGGEGVQ